MVWFGCWLPCNFGTIGKGGIDSCYLAWLKYCQGISLKWFHFSSSTRCCIIVKYTRMVSTGGLAKSGSAQGGEQHTPPLPLDVGCDSTWLLFMQSKLFLQSEICSSSNWHKIPFPMLVYRLEFVFCWTRKTVYIQSYWKNRKEVLENLNSNCEMTKISSRDNVFNSEIVY